MVKHTLTHYLAFVITGILFIVFGIVIPKFKLYWLIAGLNGRPKKEIEKYNLRYIEKYFGLFMLCLGLVTMINPILWISLDKEENIGRTFLIATLATTALLFVFGAINRKKIYNSGAINTRKTSHI